MCMHRAWSKLHLNSYHFLFEITDVNFQISKFSRLIEEYGQIMSTPYFIVNVFTMMYLCTSLIGLKIVSIGRRHIAFNGKTFNGILQFLAIGDYVEAQNAIMGLCFMLQMLFVYCYFGNQLTETAFQVNESIYFSDWYNYSPKIQKLIILIIRRSERPFILKGCSLVKCSLESFKDVS